MTFAIMKNNRPKFWTGHTTINGVDIFTTDPRPYGWKEYIVPTAPTQEGYHAEADGWEETATQIIQKWKLVPIPIPGTDVEAVVDYNLMMGNLADPEVESNE